MSGSLDTARGNSFEPTAEVEAMLKDRARFVRLETIR
ncbi:transketolase, partial [Mesorhizobium sp. M2A.F.Ca.ET.040.01.1.1]